MARKKWTGSQPTCCWKSHPDDAESCHLGNPTRDNEFNFDSILMSWSMKVKAGYCMIPLVCCYAMITRSRAPNAVQWVVEKVKKSYSRAW